VAASVNEGRTASDGRNLFGFTVIRRP
jgi:hypothetical protein